MAIIKEKILTIGDSVGGLGEDGKLPVHGIEGTGGKGLPVYEAWPDGKHDAGVSDEGKIYKGSDATND